MNEENKNMWVGIGKQILSGLVGALVAAFLLGGARQKMVTLGKDWDNWNNVWKGEIGPRLERMDNQGTLSFQHWKASYEKEQAQQYTRLQKLEEETSHLEAMELKIERLERNHSQKPNP